MDFEWNKEEARLNMSKHGVPFDDPLYIDFFDPDHSDDEERYLIIGQSHQSRLLVVSYTERGNKVRLISAREATRQDKSAYEEEQDRNGR